VVAREIWFSDLSSLETGSPTPLHRSPGRIGGSGIGPPGIPSGSGRTASRATRMGPSLRDSWVPAVTGTVGVPAPPLLQVVRSRFTGKRGTTGGELWAGTEWRGFGVRRSYKHRTPLGHLPPEGGTTNGARTASLPVGPWKKTNRRTKECRMSNDEVPRSTSPESRTNGRPRHRTARDSVRQWPDCIPGYSNGAIPAGIVGPGSGRDGRCPWSPSSRFIGKRGTTGGELLAGRRRQGLGGASFLETWCPAGAPAP